MGQPSTIDESGDSDDLQALFDSIASASTSIPAAVVPDASGDSDDLQALFDSVSAQNSTESEPAVKDAPASVKPNPENKVFNRIGHMARELHDTLRELGYDRMIENTARQIPDARQRLNYIAQMTEQAASRVLNATDIAKPIQDALLTKSEALNVRWERMFSNQLSIDEFKALAVDTRDYFRAGPTQIKQVNDQLLEIMLAQDFQDLTGQVIKKVVDMAQALEGQLLTVLIETMPEDKRAEAPAELMNGPVINSAGRADVVTTQTQVDDLLASLGF